MTNPAGEHLLGYLLGALDDAEQREVESRLERNSKLREQRSQLQERLDLLSAWRRDFDPPPGLADRTCRFVASYDRLTGQSALVAERRGNASSAIPGQRRPMSPETAPPSWISRFSWHDLVAAAGVIVAASLLLFPALQHSRFQSRLIACQDNLRQLGVAMKQYAGAHNGYFPRIPAHGQVSAAGIYVPLLQDEGLLEDTRCVVCPGSELAGRQPFRILPSAELESASPQRAADFFRSLCGSYGYCLGYVRDGKYYPTRDLNRAHFVLVADPPSNLPGLQSINHGGRGENILLEDGRFMFVTSSKPYPAADDFYFNDNGEVSAGLHANDSVIGSPSAPPIVFVGGSK